MERKRFGSMLWGIGLVALAAWLRLAHLAQVPACLEYDEAANVILAGEIARGASRPVFIRPYTGKEALYFYLAAGAMRLAGVTPFALRLTSAWLGVLNVPLTMWCARQLASVAGLDEAPARWLGWTGGALVAVSYWQMHLSRFGYRAIVLPPLLALTIGALLRALRHPLRQAWGWIALSGAWAGLAAYTYSSVRVLPILLLLTWVWILVADRRRWRARLAQFALFGLSAAALFAPLGLFFLRHPAAFSVRLQQVSVFSPAVNQGDLWGTLWRTVRLAFGMFSASGDMNPLYNLPGKPVFDPIVAPFFYLGLAVCAWRAVAPRAGAPPLARLPYALLLAWLPVMMVPNVLSASGVPHNLRAMALVPALFIIAALGLVTPLRWAAARAGRWTRPASALVAAFLVLLVAYQGGRTWHDYFAVWAPSPAPYYKGNQALIRAAELLNRHREVDPYVATYFQRHATLAIYARDYARIRWMGDETVVLPPPDAGQAILIYDHTNPLDPLLRRYLPPERLLHRELGPDGNVAFEAYALTGADRPAPAPAAPDSVNLGSTLTYLGYDLNAPAVSGRMLDLTLYFRVERAADRDDFAFFAHLVDDGGFRWGQETFFRYPSRQWRPGEVLIYRLQIPLAPGAPPGSYTLALGVFSSSLDARLPVLDAAGQISGTVVSDGPIPVARGEAPREQPPIQAPARVAFGPSLTFLGADRDRGDLLPGQTLALTLYWEAAAAVDPGWEVRIALAGGEAPIVLWQGDPAQGRYPFARWQAGEFLRDRYALRLPVDTPPGDYTLQLSVLDRQGQPVEAVDLSILHVHASDRLWEPPPFEHPVDARLGEAIELLGYDLAPGRVRPGESVHLTLIWRCRQTPDVPYTVFTHLLDPSGQLRSQKDNPPVGGTYPTTLWLPGQVVVDEYHIPVPAGTPPGRYPIEVGMYDPQTIVRLPVLGPTGAVDDRILLAPVEVTAGE